MLVSVALYPNKSYSINKHTQNEPTFYPIQSELHAGYSYFFIPDIA